MRNFSLRFSVIKETAYMRLSVFDHFVGSALKWLTVENTV